MKPRVLFLLHLPPPVYGASVVGEHVKNSEALDEAFDCDFVNIATTRAMADIGRRRIARVGIYVTLLLETVIRLLTRRYDLCYVTITTRGIAFYKDAILVGLLKLFRRKIVYHLHNKGVSSRQHKWLDNLLYKLVFANTSVILLSPCLYSDIQKYVKPHQVFYCPNGLPLFDAECSVPDSSTKTVRILFLSNLMESKGVSVLLDVCRILRDKGCRFTCEIAGCPGDITAELLDTMISSRDLSGLVSYVGAIYGGEKACCFRHADIFAFPSECECFPLVLLEAMQFALPVVSTFEGGIPDIVQDGKTGFLCPQKDAVALSHKLELLIEDSAIRERMGAEGYHRYKKYFTLDEFQKRLTHILTTVISGDESVGVKPNIPIEG
jgi:glycosyltransferase involved in cell wall biosynthesis